MLRAIAFFAAVGGLVVAGVACEPLVRCTLDEHCPFDRVCDTRQNLCLEKDDPNLPDGGGGGGGGGGGQNGADSGTATDGGTTSDGGQLSDGGFQGGADAGCAVNGCAGVNNCCANGTCAAVCI